MSKPQARTSATRLRILQAASAVFGERGFAGTSLQAISERVGMTHAGVLHHFGSKERLYIAVLEYRDRGDVAGLEGGRLPEGAALLDHLVATVRANAHRAGIVQTYAVLAAEAVVAGHPAHEYFAERFAELRVPIADAFRELAPADVPEERLRIAASAVVAVMDGLQVQWLFDDTIAMPEAVQATISGLIRWLAEGDAARS